MVDGMRMDGGPAFPGGALKGNDDEDDRYPSQPGLSLRDWFAGQAIPRPRDYQIAARARHPSMEAFILWAEATWRYAYADAMLAERAKGGGA